MNAAAALSQFEADTSTYQTDLRVRMTLQALQQLAAYLSGIPGRKNLIWVSGSFPLSILPDSSQFSPFGAIADYRDQVEKTTEMLTQSRVAVYPVDGRGLMLPSMFNASTRTAPGNGAMMQEKEGMYQEQGTMDQIADQTGGHAYYETNELKEAVANAVESGASYYTISYVPSAAKLNGEYRKIQVRVDGHDLKLAFRHGYYADGPGKRAPGAPKHMNQTVDGSLHGAPPTTQIIFKAQVLDANDPLLQGVKVPIGPAGELSATLKGPVDRYVVNFTLSPATLALGTEPDGTRTGKIELALIAYNAGGDRVNYVDHQFQLAIKPEQFERVAAKGITVLVPSICPPATTPCASPSTISTPAAPAHSKFPSLSRPNKRTASASPPAATRFPQVRASSGTTQRSIRFTARSKSLSNPFWNVANRCNLRRLALRVTSITTPVTNGC